MVTRRTPGDSYGYRHQQLRRRLLPYAYGQPCPRCGESMLPGQDLDLGHATDVVAGGADGPRQIEHAYCNRRAGQAISAARRKASKPTNTRRW